MKVHIVTGANRSLYNDEILQMHRLRYRVFVQELGWSALNSSTGLEIDDFDSEESVVYLLACEDGVVHGCLRLLPSWRRCMIKEIWPHFVEIGDVPTGPGIWEWSRWCPGSMSKPRHLLRARAALAVASLEFARSRAIDRYIGLGEIKFVGQVEEVGWRPQPLGLPRAFDEGTAVAVQWQITPGLLEHTRQVMKVPKAVAIEAPMLPNNTIFQPALLEALLSMNDEADVDRMHQALDELVVSRRAMQHQSLANVRMQGTA